MRSVSKPMQARMSPRELAITMILDFSMPDG